MTKTRAGKCLKESRSFCQLSGQSPFTPLVLQKMISFEERKETKELG